MLDVDTRRRIDTARDILVGKVPDPKSQVEQITLALMYKFMDDMDALSEEMGGKASFFTGDFGRYSWRKLAGRGIGAHEALNLYSEGIARMGENPGLPPLFRSMFNNAYLPFRDPETLRAFLGVIGEFEYDNSERLGDAFEYLLSIMGSQGDAGQFRTPRHIIDFIVEIVDPKKYDTILDPACGTAGFLVSAYKHIAKSNEDAETPLTPAERSRLAGNVSGYDISPDFVRLSLVNLYLHGFPDPDIHEYDTLTSEDRWNEYANVILANPPFMSPKGGIRPHNRFSVKSKRSEVLFVDYIAEHLTSDGRAGVIVPEGIIFQSQNAHKQLRKMLVNEYLVAVVSLPPGVFNPYSGVKTSILILDKSLARRSDSIGFFKVEDDGFDLGAQRRQIDRNDLPRVKSEVVEYLWRLRSGAGSEDWVPESGLVVAKDRIAEDGEFNLSGQRYGDQKIRTSKYDMVPFDSVCTLEYGSALRKKDRVDGPYPVMGSNGISGYHNEYSLKGPAIIVGRKGSAGEVTFVEDDCFPIDTTFYVKLVDENKIDIRYLFHVLKSLDLPNLKDGSGIPGINRKDVYSKHDLPLPPLDVQCEIVSEIEGYQKVIDGARAVVENWRPRIAVDPEWPVVELGEVFDRSNETVDPKTIDGSVNYIGLQNITSFNGETKGNIVLEDPIQLKSLKNMFNVGDILYGKLRPNLNKVWQSDMYGICSTDIFVIRPISDNVDAVFFSHIMRSESFNNAVVAQVAGAQLPRIGWSSFRKLPIPLPPLRTQRTIVDEILAETRLVQANRRLIERMEEKIREVVGRIWSQS